MTITTRVVFLMLVVTLALTLPLAALSAGDTGAQNAAPEDPKGRLPESSSNWVLKDKEKAVARALEIFGLSETGDSTVFAELVTLAEDNTPYLSTQIAGKPVWKVGTAKSKLVLQSAPPG